MTESEEIYREGYRAYHERPSSDFTYTGIDAEVWFDGFEDAETDDKERK